MVNLLFAASYYPESGPSPKGDLEAELDSYYAAKAGEQPISNDQASTQDQSIKPQPQPKAQRQLELQRAYEEAHRRWRPSINKHTMSVAIAAAQDMATEGHLRSFSPPLNSEAFINYFHTTTTIGEEPLPIIIHHAACGIQDNIYLLGGCIAAHDNYSIEGVDLSKYVINAPDLPIPIDNELLCSPFMIPNSKLFVVSSITNSVRSVSTLGETPPPLLYMSASQITKRHIFYYGGLEVIDEVKRIGDKFIINRSFKLNNAGYVLDVVTSKFQKFELTAQPNPTTRYPITVPRFGHTSTILSISSRPATVYIMGGFRESSHKKFEAIRDLWKVELSIIYEGDNNYVEFGDVVLATPISTTTAPPCGRAFHSADVHENSIVYHGGTDGEEIFGDVWKFDFINETWTEMQTHFQGKRSQLKKVGHQAIILDKYLVPIAGIIPADIEDPVYSNDGDEIPDISGAPRSNMEASRPETSLYFWQYCMNINTAEWIPQRVYHDYNLQVPGLEDEFSGTGCLGATLTCGNSCCFLIGGQVTARKFLTRHGKLYILNSGLGAFEFPLGNSISHAKRVV